MTGAVAPRAPREATPPFWLRVASQFARLAHVFFWMPVQENKKEKKKKTRT
jgi:hypothetical protein